MKQRSGSSSLSALKLKSFSSLVKWCAAHYTRHMKCHVSLRDLYGLCVNARTDSGKSLAVWMQQIWRSGNKCRNTLPVYFPESLCERGLSDSGSSIPSRLRFTMRKSRVSSEVTCPSWDCNQENNEHPDKLFKTNQLSAFKGCGLSPLNAVWADRGTT